MQRPKRNWLMLAFGVLFMAILVTATTIITDTSITMDRGDLINVGNITLGDEPLFFRGGINNDIRAIFNGNSSIVLQVAQGEVNLNISRSVTSFLGDVDNFDNINAFSRFRETNINNGTNASAGFIGVNDIGHSLSIGIASSNFEFMNLSLPNIGAMRLKSPSDMFFVNDFFTGWFWVADQNNNTGIEDARTAMDLDAKGNLEIIGNFTGTQFYAEGSFFDPLSPQTVTPSATFVATNINFTDNRTNGLTMNNQQEYEVLVAGLYKSFYSVSYTDGAAQSHIFAIGLNGEMQNNTAAASSTSTSNHIATPTGGGFINVSVGDNLSLATMDITGGVNAIDVIAATFNVVRIGS